MDQPDLQSDNTVYNHFQAPINVQPVPCAGKGATGTKRGKTCNPLPNPGKRTTAAKPGRT